jgi:hypothetical protein
MMSGFYKVSNGYEERRLFCHYYKPDETRLYTVASVICMMRSVYDVSKMGTGIGV